MIEALETRAVEAAHACARAEFGKWSAVLNLRESMVDEIEADESAMFKRMAINATALKVGRLLQLSEQQVWRITEQASRLRDHLPAAWAAFADGTIDVQKASCIATLSDRATQPATVAALDDVVVDYATNHTCSELRRWINKIIERLEPVDLDQAEAARAERHVSVQHRDHGMSLISGLVPTTAAVASMNRLRKAAKTMNDPDDDRTRAQKQADLFASWLTNATGTECDIRAEVAVVVEAQALAGVTDASAHVIDLDDDLPIPTSWAFDITGAGSTLWTRLLTDPTGRVLDVTHLGYQPTEALRTAVQWRDMTCRISGCHQRAELTDLDHRTPFDTGGQTVGSNLQCLCRRHHGIKGHGLLPPDAYDPPAIHTTRLPSPTINVDLYFDPQLDAA